MKEEASMPNIALGMLIGFLVAAAIFSHPMLGTPSQLEPSYPEYLDRAKCRQTMCCNSFMMHAYDPGTPQEEMKPTSCLEWGECCVYGDYEFSCWNKTVLNKTIYGNLSIEIKNTVEGSEEAWFCCGIYDNQAYCGWSPENLE